MHLLAPKLLHCAQHDNVSRLKCLLLEEHQESSDPSSQWLCGVCYDKSGDTLAHVASRHGSVNTLRFLVEEIGSTSFLDAANLDGKRPLHEAAQSSQLETVKFLIENGCQVDPLKRADWTPLMLACTKQNLQVVRLLIEKGANLMLRNKDGWTPFHIVCREGHASIVSYLLDTCADVSNCCSNNKRTPLHTAAGTKRDGNSGGFRRASLEDATLKFGMHSTRLQCIEPGTRHSCSPNLVQAVQSNGNHGRVECVDVLLERGNYPPDGRDNCKSTPFMDAAQGNHTDIMERLASHKGVKKMFLRVNFEQADVAAVDILGRNSLHLAAQAGAIAAVRLLVGKYALEPNTTDMWGQTALHYAAKRGHSLVVDLLLSFGALPSLKDNKGRTACDLARNADHQDCCQLLDAHIL